MVHQLVSCAHSGVLVQLKEKHTIDTSSKAAAIYQWDKSVLSQNYSNTASTWIMEENRHKLVGQVNRVSSWVWD